MQATANQSISRAAVDPLSHSAALNTPRSTTPCPSLRDVHGPHPSTVVLAKQASLRQVGPAVVAGA
jgi:hypothetical protein